MESTAFDPNGRLWIGTRDGLYTYQPQTQKLRRMPDTDGLLIWNICPMRNGQGLWLGTNQGVYQLDFQPQRLQYLPLHPKTDGTDEPLNVFTILEDSAHRLWVGTEGKGLFRADMDSTATALRFFSFQEKAAENGLDALIVYSLHEAADQTLWVGTQTGLYAYGPNGLFKKTAEDRGKASNIIKGIEEDQEHRLWLTTHLGITVYKPSTGELLNLNTLDGMSSDIFNIGACEIVSDSLLLAGSLKGLIALDLQTILKHSDDFPKSYIAGLAINNQPLQQGDTLNGRVIADVAPRFLQAIELESDENNLSIVFGGIEVNHPDRIQWAYRIPELDTSWHLLPPDQHSITLFNLPKGHYQLEYKSTNQSGKWSDEAEMLSITILPHWSQTVWAYLVYVVLFLALLIYLFNYQMRKIKEKETIEHERALHKQALALEQDKIEFFTNVSHELRTPMTLITAPLLKMKEKGRDLSEEKRDYYVNLMYKNTVLLNRQIEQLLNFSKIQNGKARLKLGYHAVAQVIQRTVANFTEYAAQKDITLAFTDRSSLGQVVCDDSALEIILCNLISNAIKYSPSGSHVDIMLTTPDTRPDCYCISVQDEGIGISESQQKDIFKRFARLNNAESKASGIGIGLAYVHSLVILHQGEITVKSQLHAGSCFSVYLPKQLTAQSDSQSDGVWTGTETAQPVPLSPITAAATEADTDDGEKDTLLIVEDNPDLRAFLCTLFADRYHVIQADNGADGLQLASEQLPDLIISDVMMPQMDGFEMTQALKQRFETSHIPVILLTAKGEVGDELQGFESGADFYLKKPFLPNQLELIVQNIQQRQARMRRYLLDQHPETITDDTAAETEVKDDFIVKVEAYVLDHIDSPDLTVETLSEAMNLSSVQLYRKLKAVTDFTPNDFIRHIRMKCAVDRLMNDSLNIAEVAYAVGYSDPKYFSKCFKTVYGMSPTAYLKAQNTRKS